MTQFKCFRPLASARARLTNTLNLSVFAHIHIRSHPVVVKDTRICDANQKKVCMCAHSAHLLFRNDQGSGEWRADTDTQKVLQAICLFVLCKKALLYNYIQILTPKYVYTIVGFSAGHILCMRIFKADNLFFSCPSICSRLEWEHKECAHCLCLLFCRRGSKCVCVCVRKLTTME